MGCRRRGGGKGDSQGGGKREKKRKIMQHCAIFTNPKNAKWRGTNPGLKGTGNGRFKPPCPLLNCGASVDGLYWHLLVFSLWLLI